LEDQAAQVVQVRWLGKMEYDHAWQIQEQTAAQIAAGERLPTLVLVEHPPVYTLGRKAKRENVLWDDARLAQAGISLRWVDRGGDVTYHGPGQLVGYPILPLAQKDWAGGRLPQADYVGYIRRLEDVIIATLARLGVVSGQRKGFSGVWVPADVYNRCPRCDPAKKAAPHKIASIGVKVDVNGISSHGFALNIDTEATHWEGIIPCGLEGVSMVNLADFRQPVPQMAEVIDALLVSFAQEFKVQLERLGDWENRTAYKIDNPYQ
jgi:lipoyl(octanoyl) transferase